MNTPVCRWPDADANNRETQRRGLPDCVQVFEDVESGASCTLPFESSEGDSRPR